MEDVFKANSLASDGWGIGELLDWGDKGYMLLLFKKNDDSGDSWKSGELDEEDGE